MKNSLMDMHNMMFEELEKLSDCDLKGDDLIEEVKRANSMARVGMVIVMNANTMLQGTKVNSNFGDIAPEFITSEEKKMKSLEEVIK